jgi:DNA-directed RNA polymerase II subunit RPB1
LNFDTVHVRSVSLNLCVLLIFIIPSRNNCPEATRQLFTGLQMIVNFWLFHNGFSIGIGDTIANHNTMSYITQNNADHERKADVTQFIDDATHDRLKAAPGMTIHESFEHLKVDNNVKQMVAARSKGSFINISQMSVCVGQQSVEGGRIPFGFRH